MNASYQGVDITKRLLREAFEGVQEARCDWKNSPLEFTTEEELSSFAEELNLMLEAVESRQIREVPGLWRIVTDVWPYTSTLRQKIVEAELSYEKCSRSLRCPDS